MMNRKVIPSLILIFILAFSVSCMPVDQNNNQSDLNAAIQKAVIETKAAATIEAANAADQDTTDDSGETGDQDDQEPTSTEQPPTNTPEPTATMTPTATLQPTPTLPPDDPTSGLGDPTFIDKFDNPAYWLQYEDSESAVTLVNNELVYTNKVPNSFTLWRVSWPEIQDFYLDVIAQVPGGCSGKDEYGLFFRTDEWFSGHLFTISCNGQYRLRLWDGDANKMEVLIGWTQSAHINTEPNAINRIGVKAVDEEVTLYVNGFFLATLISSEYDGMAEYGLTVNSVNTDNLTIHFSELRYWDLAE